MTIDNDIYNQELQRGIAKYPPELWATLDGVQMIHALEREVEELKTALWKGELEGDHGIVKESFHVQIVAYRIREEMKRRGANGAL